MYSKRAIVEAQGRAKMDSHNVLRVFFGVLVAVPFMVTAQTPEDLPSGFQKCRNDAEFSECMQRALPVALKELADGDPQFGIPPMDPLRVQRLEIGQHDPNNPLNLSVNITNIMVRGLKDATVSDVVADMNNFRFSCKGHSAHFYVDGDYIANGLVFGLPVTGNGRFHANITNLHALIRMEGEGVQRNGETYMTVTKFTNEIYNIQHLSVQFENLFNGDKLLGDSANALVNAYWRELWRSEVQHPLEELLRETFRDHARRIFDRVPYNKVFLP